MEIEILNKKENPLLNRTEVQFKAIHPQEKTPKREALKEKLAKTMNKSKDRVIIDSMSSAFGVAETIGYAKIYKKKEDAAEIERKHILQRDQRKSKAPEKKEEPAAEEAPAEEKAEEGEQKEEAEEKPEEPEEKKEE